MKNIPLIVGAALASLLVGCSSTPVTLAPVGPGPFASRVTASDTGRLQVYSLLVTRSEGSENPDWHQHSHYYISDASGRHNRYIENTVGHYEKRPRTLQLAAGRYIVKARASGGEWVELPVIIKPGETTIVHLDHGWNPANIPETDVVSMPNGSAVGWRGDLASTGKAD